MGRTPKPLNIVVTNAELFRATEIQALRDKGHRVTILDLGDIHLVLGPECCAMDRSLVKYVTLAVKRAWDRLAGRAAGDVDEQEGVASVGRADVKGGSGVETDDDGGVES